MLEGDFNPKPAVIDKREQLPGEIIAEYMAELCHLSTYCNFGCYLNEALRDRLVCGLQSESTQRRLLAIKDLTLKEAVEQAQAMETADKDSNALQGTKNTGVHKVVESRMVLPAKQPQRQQHPCYRCGKANHTPTKCRFMGAICQNCGKVGHIAAGKCSLSVRKKNKFSKQTEKYCSQISSKSKDSLC